MKRVNESGISKIDFSEVAKNRGTGGKAVPSTTKRPTRKQIAILQAKQAHPELTSREVAKIAATDHAYVIRTLRRYGLSTPRDLDLYKRRRADILAGLQSDQICTYYTLSEAEKKKLILRRGMVDLGITYDKERLERDLSTVNVEAVIADLEALRKVQETENDQE